MRVIRFFIRVSGGASSGVSTFFFFFFLCLPRNCMPCRS